MAAGSGLNSTDAGDRFNIRSYDLVQWNPSYLEWNSYGYDTDWEYILRIWSDQVNNDPTGIYRIVLVETEIVHTDVTSIAERELKSDPPL